MLEGHKKIKVQEEQQMPVKQEYKFLGSLIKKRGQKIFAFDTSENRIYEVVLEKRVVFDTAKKAEKSKFKAHCHPDHMIIYAINMKNAIRKVKKYGYDIDKIGK